MSIICEQHIWHINACTFNRNLAIKTRVQMGSSESSGEFRDFEEPEGEQPSEETTTATKETLNK